MKDVVENLLFMVQSIRFQSLHPLDSGAVVFGYAIDSQGEVDRAVGYLLKVTGRQIIKEFEIGQTWKVSGESSIEPRRVDTPRGHFLIDEVVVSPSQFELVRPSGSHIIVLLAEGKEFKDIGETLAQRMWNTYGEELYSILDNKNVEKIEILKGISRDTAINLCNAWESWGNSNVISWLQKHKFPILLGKRLVTVFGSESKAKIEEDAYRLLSFCDRDSKKYEGFRKIDKFARKQFNISVTDERRLNACIEQALYTQLDDNDTCATDDTLMPIITNLIDDGGLGREKAIMLAKSTLSLNSYSNGCNGVFVRRGGYIFLPGSYVMEMESAKYIVDNSKSNELLFDVDKFNDFIERYNSKYRVELGEKQVEAVALANNAKLTIIIGGAGTGKTTTLRSIFGLLFEHGYELHPVALSGKAAKRIAEATGEASQTIAGFIKRFVTENAAEKGVLIIDESSMVDLISFYNLVTRIPETWRLILVGDQHQLPPVGAGLILHELVASKSLKKNIVELSQIHRYGGAIAEAANLVKNQKWPEFTTDHCADICFIPCRASEINKLVLDLFNDDRDTQILCALKFGLNGSVQAINSIIQAECNGHGQPVEFYSQESRQIIKHSFLRLGDTVILTKNHNDEDLQNGSIGVITSVEKPSFESSCLVKIDWDDGIQRKASLPLLEDLSLGYAITIHKSQGSGFNRIIIPVVESNLLDSTLMYTAITRAKYQVILVGDELAAKRAVEGQPHATMRTVGLKMFIEELMNVGDCLDNEKRPTE